MKENRAPGQVDWFRNTNIAVNNTEKFEMDEMSDISKVHVNTKNKLLSAQLRLTAGFSQTERRDEGQNVFCFFFPTGFTTFLQLVLCPLVPPPLSG